MYCQKRLLKESNTKDKNDLSCFLKDKMNLVGKPKDDIFLSSLKKVYKEDIPHIKGKTEFFIAPSNNISVFPNPVSSKQAIWITLPTYSNENMNVYLFDVSGKLIFQKTLHSKAIKNNMFELQPDLILKEGLYFLRVQDANASYVERISVVNGF